MTDFYIRVQKLQAVTGKSQVELADLLQVSRTTLHHYCRGQNLPKPATWFRLEQAERQWLTGAVFRASAVKEVPPADRPLPEGPALFADERARTEIDLARHLRWLHGAQLRQQEVALAAQRQLHEIDGWVRETEAELARVRKSLDHPAETSPKDDVRRPAARREKRTQLRDIETVSLPIFGALPAGWPQTREGVLTQRPTRMVTVMRGRFPEGAFGLEVRGDSMNAAQPVPIFDRDVVVLLSPEQRPPQSDDIVAALIDGDICLKRLKTRRKKGAFLRSESTNPVHGEIYPAHDLVIQGVFVGKV